MLNKIILAGFSNNYNLCAHLYLKSAIRELVHSRIVPVKTRGRGARASRCTSFFVRVQSHFSAPLFPFLIGTPNEPVVLIEYQAKCNYGWNSCFVGANNLPWHGTQWNGNEGIGREGCVESARARALAQGRGGGRARCVIKTLIIQSITNAIIGGRADGRGWDFRSCRDSAKRVKRRG